MADVDCHQFAVYERGRCTVLANGGGKEGQSNKNSPFGRVGAPETEAVAPAAYVVGRGDVGPGVVVVPIGIVPMVTEPPVFAMDDSSPTPLLLLLPEAGLDDDAAALDAVCCRFPNA